MEVLGRQQQATVYAGEEGAAIKVFDARVEEPAVRKEAEIGDAVYLLGAPAPRAFWRTLFLVVDADGPDGPTGPGPAPLRAEFGTAFLESFRRASGPIGDEEIAVWRPVTLAARLGEDIARERDPLLQELLS